MTVNDTLSFRTEFRKLILQYMQLKIVRIELSLDSFSSGELRQFIDNKYSHEDIIKNRRS